MQMDIALEFPLEVIGNYHGMDNLDITVDEHMVPIIHESIVEHGAYIKRSDFNILPASNRSEGYLSYQISILLYPPSFDLACIVKALSDENFEKGLRIYSISKNGDIKTLYEHDYYGNQSSGSNP